MRIEERGCCYYILSFNRCPYTLYTDRPLLLFKSCVKGPQIDCSGWMSFWQVVFPNTHLRLSEKPFGTHVMPFHTSRPLYVLFQELPPFCPPRLHTRQFLPIVSTQHPICEALPNEQHSLAHTARKGQWLILYANPFNVLYRMYMCITEFSCRLSIKKFCSAGYAGQYRNPVKWLQCLLFRDI